MRQLNGFTHKTIKCSLEATKRQKLNKEHNNGTLQRANGAFFSFYSKMRDISIKIKDKETSVIMQHEKVYKVKRLQLSKKQLFKENPVEETEKSMFCLIVSK